VSAKCARTDGLIGGMRLSRSLLHTLLLRSLLPYYTLYRLGVHCSLVEYKFRRKADGKLYTVKVARGRNSLYVVRICVTSCVCVWVGGWVCVGVCVCVCVCVHVRNMNMSREKHTHTHTQIDTHTQTNTHTHTHTNRHTHTNHAGGMV